MTTDTHKETLAFQAEVRELLRLMVHSLYSHKEIFLRELISNAADACDKLRFEALTDDALFEGDTDLAVRLDVDAEGRTLTLTDNGIGMSRSEVMENLGTIAHSGTRRFLESLTGDAKADASLIGQFGVGFYSAFMVADRVTVETRRAGLGPEHGVRWESRGEGEYSLETIERPERGTRITLHLREGEEEFLDPLRLRTIVHRYSDHIPLPVRMKSGDGADTDGYETVNKASALWTRPRQEISDDEYKAFYQHLSHDFEAPLAWLHNRVEGSQVYTTLFYIPRHPPFDLWDRERRRGVKLHVRRVFVMDDAEQLLPAYLRFVQGVVDSDDLPLNISREILQHNRLIDSIRTASVKRLLGLLEDMARDRPEDYALFWDAFGQVLKEGVVEDPGNRERIAGLLRFASTKGDGERQRVSLADYLGRMQEGQKSIYYLTAENAVTAAHSPHLERFRERGLEVLLLTDRVDEWLVAHLTEFDGRPLVSVNKGELDLDELATPEEAERERAAGEAAAGLLERIRQVLGDRVRDVRASHRLTRSPSCVVLEQGDMGMHMQRILRQAGHSVPESRPILEINPTHPLVQGLERIGDEAHFQDWAELLLEQALLVEGGELGDAPAFVERMNRLLQAAAGAD